MALTSFPSLYSGLDTPESGTSQVETHRIPTSSPYEVILSRIPRCSAASTAVTDNAFTTIAAFRAECTATIAGAAATIIESQTPTASGQIAMQIVAGGAYEFSPKAIFHSSDAGKTAVFTYFGFMSNADSRYVEAVQQAVQRVEELPPCAIFSAATYDSGRFGRGTADSTSITVAPLRGAVATDTHGRLSFAGGTVNLAQAGATQVAAFTDTDAYKTISVYLQDISGVLTVRTAESAEVASKPTTPTITAADGWLCGAVLVHGDSTGNAGGILAIAQADCWSLWDASGGGLWSQIQGKPTTFPPDTHTHDYAASNHTHAYVWTQTFTKAGTIADNDQIDFVYVLPVAAELIGGSVFMGQGGDDGANQFDIQYYDVGWTSKFTNVGTMESFYMGSFGGGAINQWQALNLAELTTPLTFAAQTWFRIICLDASSGTTPYPADARVTLTFRQTS